jgi:hypothetical protein
MAAKKYVMTAARKAAFRKAQEKAWAMRRGKKAAKKAVKSAPKKLNLRTASDEKLIKNLGIKRRKMEEANLVGDWDLEKKMRNQMDKIGAELSRRTAMRESRKVNRTGLFARPMVPGLRRY